MDGWLMRNEIEFELAMMECENSFLSDVNSYSSYFLEAGDTGEKIVHVLATARKKVEDLIQKILKELSKVYHDLILKIRVKSQQEKIKKKLEEIKNLMAKKKSSIVNKKLDFFDMQKYKKYYDEFIDSYTKELLNGLNREFRNVDEYEKWRNDMLSRLNEFNFKLSDEEQWKLRAAINSAVELTEKEVNNQEKSLQMVYTDGSNRLRAIEKEMRIKDNGRSFVNVGDDKLMLYKLQNSFIGQCCTKLGAAIRKALSFIVKHIIGCLSALVAFLIIL